MRTPDTPRPSDRSDADAERLLEAGLDSGRTRAAPPPPPEAIAPHFPALEILEVLGQGGMGVVYKARQKALDRVVALKVLPASLSQDPAFAERFTREARMLAKLQHPHIVLVYEFGESDGLHYLLMEYVEGVNLRQLMDTHSLTPAEALAIVPQICDALQYAHDQGVVHRDIKPENVLLDRAGKVKVADFGLAKLVQRGPADVTLTGTGQVMGTVQYMAPEQYKSPQDVDHRADIFSLGVVFYEMLTGDLPVGRFAKPSDVTSVDARIDEIVLRALERERELRFQQADDVKSEISTAGEAAPPRQRFGQRHAARQAARAETHGGRRFSKWALLAAISIPIAVILGALVFAAVEELSAGHGGWKKYYATIAGYWTVIGGFVLAAVISLVAVIVTARRRHRVRGHWAALLALVVAVALIPVTLVVGLKEVSSVARQRNLSVYVPPGRFPSDIEVKGASSDFAAHNIRIGVSHVWHLYVAAMRDRDLDVADVRPMYAKDDWSQLRAMPPDELARRMAERTLGMGLVGKRQLTVPPWEIEIWSVEVDPWKRQAKLTLRSETPYLRVVVPMRRDEGRWVFALAEVMIETKDDLPVVLMDDDDR